MDSTDSCVDKLRCVGLHRGGAAEGLRLHGGRGRRGGGRRRRRRFPCRVLGCGRSVGRTLRAVGVDGAAGAVAGAGAAVARAGPWSVGGPCSLCGATPTGQLPRWVWSAVDMTDSDCVKLPLSSSLSASASHSLSQLSLRS